MSQCPLGESARAYRVAAWRPSLAACPGRPPAWMRRLLSERGSLTERLERRGPVAVRVLGEGWQRPAVDEALALGLGRGRRAWLREVILDCEGGPVIYARSLVPGRPRGALAPLPRLGARPLGRLVFASAGARRSRLAVARLRGTEPLARRMAAYGLPGGCGAWARRSLLWAAQQRLLVTEVFLASTTCLEEAEGERGRVQPQ